MCPSRRIVKWIVAAIVVFALSAGLLQPHSRLARQALLSRADHARARKLDREERQRQQIPREPISECQRSRSRFARCHSRGNGKQHGLVPDYGYVPGLQQNDPGQLVLMYFNRPTRWTMHISAPTIFEGKEWILIPVDFGQGRREKSGPGEESERVSTEEFKRRLKETIEYVRKMERPNWKTIVAEQTTFLERIDGLDR